MKRELKTERIQKKTVFNFIVYNNTALGATRKKMILASIMYLFFKKQTKKENKPVCLVQIVLEHFRKIFTGKKNGISF